MAPRLTARHGAIERGALAHGGGTGDVARERGAARGEVDENRTGLRGRKQAVAGEVELFDILGIAYHREDDVRARGSLGGRRGKRGAALHERLGLRLRAVVDGERIARVEDVPGDGRTHDAGANEGDLLLLICHDATPMLEM